MPPNPPLPPPKILTRSDASTLIADLDASDVLECYSLTRTVKLGGFHNATIQKMAIGLRYGGSTHKAPLELTLEYGPERLGHELQEESMPVVISGDHLAWDNEGKVYYTTSTIRSYQWKSAYYMASLTGAVLEKILEKAALYSSLKPRYQPFAVVVASDSAADGSYGAAPSTQDNRLIHVLKSSSSVDFCVHIWSYMVDLGVDLTPILSPPTYIPRLHVSGKVVKVSGYNKDGLYVPQQATHFFESFSACWKAIATGDYSSYETGMPSLAPSTISPSTAMTDEPSYQPLSRTDEPSEQLLPTTDMPSMSPLIESSVPPVVTNVPTISKRKHNTNDASQTATNHTKSLGENVIANATGNDIAANAGSANDPGMRALARSESGHYHNRPTRRSLWQRILDVSERFLDQSSTETVVDGESKNDDVFLGELAFHNLTISPLEVSNASSLYPSSSPTGDTASEAQKAANEAHAAAQQAKNASTHESAELAADAAEHAADAAQKAANAARWEKDVESMNSGDGALVAQALQRCWTDPLYGMSTGNSTTVVGYMFLDGNFYFQMNLTPPYFDIVEAQMQIPQAHDQNSGSMLTPDNFVDWTLAFCIIGFFLVGFFAFLQQFGLRLAFYRRQKFFFDPTSMRSDDDDGDDCCSGTKGRRRIESDDDSLVIGTVQDDVFSEDVIPLSMGGRRPLALGRSSHLLVTNSPNSQPRNTVELERDGDVELVSVSNNLFSMFDDQHQGVASSSPTTQLPPPRFTRDPDLVDMPSLRSRSKVARPVTLDSLESNESFNSE